MSLRLPITVWWLAQCELLTINYIEMELQQILNKMEADGWEISDDFKTAHGHFLQYFLETVEEALRQPPVSGMLKCASCENTAKKDGLDCYGKCHICTQAF